ncbi:SpoIIE family protein phosphatase [Kineococcus sp. SYSU DK001]|uniref:SpoIIE family protein phosphatase n=1 Tax=Kineococcus sp. SYSU DK001 TaxID=3383122 RepID=UPI003D7C96F4
MTNVLRLDALFAHLPTAHLVLDRDLVIVEANRAYTTMLDRTREELVGRHVFDAFPPPDGDLDEHGAHRTELSFRRVLAGETDVLPAVRYDVTDPGTGQLHPRHWSVVNAPLRGADGEVQFILQRAEDITDYVLERARADGAGAELFLRDREVEAARLAEQVAARTVAAQALVALDLIDATTCAEAAEVLRRFGRSVLGAATVAVHLLDERPAGSAAAEVTAAGCTTLVQTAVVVDGVQLGELALGWRRPHELTPTDHEVVGAVAAQYGQAVLRLRRRDAERRATENALVMSETLQRSLLSEPARLDGLELTTRYRAAAQQARVGGDWYDGFRTADGTAVLTVGDVSGHDGEAAALMGQVRSLLRGIAYAVPAHAGQLLDVVDDALFDLGVDALASAVLVTVHHGADGGRTVRWSNAGHPPPLVQLPDGSVQVLARTPELLLGCQTGTGRTVHEHPFPDGASLLLYTDGLVERRGSTIDDGIDWLRRRLESLAGRSAEEVCDELLTAVDGEAKDDVVLLLARAVPVTADLVEATLAGGPTAVARARELVTTACRRAQVAEGTRDAAVLVASEAVTNALVHGRGAVRLAVSVRDAAVRLEVSDSEPATPVRRAVDLDALGGRGMQLVDALAADWGVRARRDGKTVWIDVR